MSRWCLNCLMMMLMFRWVSALMCMLAGCRLTVVVEDAAGFPAGQSQLSLTISDEVQLESVTLAFSEGESQDAINETLPYPQALATKSATLDPSQTLKVLPGPCHV